MRRPAAPIFFAGSQLGEAFFPQSVPEVVPLCERIAHDIRNQ